MRLNFSGVDEDAIREGVRRIGKVVAGADRRSTRRSPPARAAPPRRAAAPPSRPPSVVELRRRSGVSRVARPQGRALARAPGVAELRRPRRGRAGAPRPRGASPIDVGPDLVGAAARAAAGRGVRRPARRGRRGRRGPGAARGARDPVHGLAARRLRALLGQGADQARAARRRAADPEFYAFTPDRVPRPRRRARRCRRSSGGSASRSSSSRRAAGRRWGSSSPAPPPTCRRARRRLRLRHDASCSSASSPGATWPCRCSTASALPVIEAVPEGDALRLRGPLRDRPHVVRLPAPSCPTAMAARAQELAVAVWDALGLPRLRPRRPDARRRDRGADGARGQRDPRADGNQPRSPRPPTRPASRFDELVARLLELAVSRFSAR